MRILIVTQKVDSEDQLLGFFIDWIKILANKFESIVILCLVQNKFLLPGNVRVVSLGKDRGESKAHQLFNFYKYIWLLRREYDAVFVHMNPIWVTLGGFWWHRMSKKVFFWYTHKAVTTKLRIAEKFADVIFTASKESFRLPSRKIVITGHGIDTNFFRPDSSRKKRDGIVKILSVGRVAPIKNYETLVGAAKILDNRQFGFSTAIIGEPALKKDELYERRLRDRIKDLGLEDHFEFLGKVAHKDLAPHYQSHDIFVHLSKTGSVDKTLLEAMACGMKVLSCNDSARAFLPPDLLFGEDSSEELAEKIMKASAKEAGPELRAYVLENHDLDKLINKITQVINERNIA